MALRLPMDRGETLVGMYAKTALRPTLRAANTIARFDRSTGKDLDITALVEKLGQQVSNVQAGEMGRPEEMLVAQAHTLDMLFHELAQRSMLNLRAGYLDAGEAYMRLALRTQSQSRSTLETLSLVKNPRSVAFVRQANIANGPQQVNNGTATSELPRAGESELEPSKLLEQQHGERLDSKTAQAAIGAHPAMAAVGKVNWSANGRG